MLPSLLCAAAALAAAAAAQAPFFRACERRHLEPDPGPVERVLVADVDGDGAPDLLVRGSDGTQSWYRNDGHGVFSARTLSLAESLLFDAAVGDVDADGDDDLLLQGQLHRNLGGGQFALDPAAMPANALGCDGQVLADIDGDGDLDLLARPLFVTSFGLRAFRNDGAGRFTDVGATAFGAPTPYPSSFQLTDADRDGDVDVVAVLAGVASGQLLRNDGTGHFTAGPIAALPNGAGTSVDAAGDVDGDGDDDLLCRIAGAATRFLQNDGRGSYAPVSATGLPAFAGGVLVDLDQDGRVDLVPAGGTGWLQSLGGFRFQPRDFPPFPWGDGALTFRDLDGDRDADAVAAGAQVRLLCNVGGRFRDANQPLIVRAPPAGAARPIRAASTRLDDGAAPAAEIAWLENGQPFLASTRDPSSRLPAEGTFGLVALPPVASCTSLATFAPTAAGASLVACTTAGPRLLRRTDAYTATDDSGLLHALGTPRCVACADLQGAAPEEIVFGAPDVAGPQILAPDATGHLWPSVPALPAAAPSPAPVYEQVLLADIDGDGDLDIVHELRIVRNDGNGRWSAGPDLAALVPGDATGMLALDADGDGDQDLVVWDDAAVLLLEDLGASFRDATFGHLPLSMPHSTGITAGDVDRDGDPDLLQIEGTLRANLLRNDRGVFTRLVDAAPIGVLADLDHDGDADVFDGYRLFQGAFGQLFAPRLPGPGADYRLELHTWRTGPYALAAFVALATAPAFAALPGLGALRLDPQSGTGTGLLLLAGQADLAVPIPASPGLQGLPFWCQALTLDPDGRLLLTGALHEVIE